MHCLAGVSRSVSLVMAYFIKYHNMNYDSVYTKIKSRRKIVRFKLFRFTQTMDLFLSWKFLKINAGKVALLLKEMIIMKWGLHIHHQKDMKEEASKDTKLRHKSSMSLLKRGTQISVICVIPSFKQILVLTRWEQIMWKILSCTKASFRIWGTKELKIKGPKRDIIRLIGTKNRIKQVLMD